MVKTLILLLTWIFLISNNFYFPLTYLDASLHYSIYFGEGVTYSILFMETFRFVCIFLVCYYVTKKTSSLLPSRNKWLHNLKVFFVINLLWLFITLTMAILAYHIFSKDYSLLCHTTIFITTRTGGEISTIIFFIVGCVVTHKVRKLPRQTAYDYSLIPMQKRSLKRLWMIISCCVIVCLLLCIYDLFIYDNEDCRILINSVFWNDFIWVTNRALATFVWTIPILYLLWPKI